MVCPKAPLSLLFCHASWQALAEPLFVLSPKAYGYSILPYLSSFFFFQFAQTLSLSKRPRWSFKSHDLISVVVVVVSPKWGKKNFHNVFCIIFGKKKLKQKISTRRRYSLRRKFGMASVFILYTWCGCMGCIQCVHNRRVHYGSNVQKHSKYFWMWCKFWRRSGMGYQCFFFVFLNVPMHFCCFFKIIKYMPNILFIDWNELPNMFSWTTPYIQKCEGTEKPRYNPIQYNTNLSWLLSKTENIFHWFAVSSKEKKTIWRPS